MRVPGVPWTFARQRLAAPSAAFILILCAVPAAFAQRLPETVRPTHYKVTLAPDLTAETFSGSVSIDVEVREKTSAVVLHALDLEIRAATVTQDGDQAASVRLDQEQQQATLSVARALQPGKATLKMAFSGALNKQLAGLYIGRSRDRAYAATQFQATDARRAFPCFDEPDLKATFDITAIIDEGDVAISNGRQVSDVAGPGTGKRTLTFATTPLISSYLVALFVGDFECLSDSVDGTPVRVCALGGRVQQGQYALEIAGRFLRFFNEQYGIDYPFGKLDHIAIPDYAAGAMENPGAIVYREVLLLVDPTTASPFQKRLVATVIAHEIAHQWFGNLVTMKWWDDIWLNEGFASWMESKPLVAFSPEWQRLLLEADTRARALAADSVAAARAIRSSAETPAEISALFDGIAFEKSAAVLRMLEQYVGPAPMREGVTAYLRKFAYGNATSEDFARTLAAASGRAVDRVLDSFVRHAGAPLVRVRTECSRDAAAVAIDQRRFFLDPALAAAAPPSQWELPVCLRDEHAERHCHLLTRASERFQLPRCGRWRFANAGGHGYYRTLYDSADRAAILAAVRELTPDERLAFYADEWAFVAPGLQTAADYLSLVNAARAERQYSAWARLIKPLEQVHDEIIAEADRPAFQQWVRSLAAPVLADLGSPAPTDTDEQRQFRALALWMAAALGADPAARTVLSEALEGYLTRPADIDPSLVGAAIAAAPRMPDEATFDRFVERAQTPSSPLDRVRFLSSLTAFRDERLVRRALALILTADVRSQDVLGLLSTALSHPIGRQVGWPFLKANFSELMEKIGPGPGAGIVNLAGRLCDERLVEDARRFFGDGRLPGFERPLEESVQQARACVQLRAAQQGSIRKWLADRR